MTDTTTKFEPGFWGQTHPLSGKQVELFAKLVPPQGDATTAHGEVLRAVTRIYYDVYNNGLCNGPFSEEAATLRRFRTELTTRMEEPDAFDSLLRAVAPRNVEYGNMKYIRDLSTWAYGPALEDLMAAVVKYVDHRVTELESSGSPGGVGVSLVPPTHEFAQAEAALAGRHLKGNRAETFAGELFRAMRSLATALEVKGCLAPEHRYELGVLSRFASDLPVAAETVQVVNAALDYQVGVGNPIPALHQWPLAGEFAQVCEAVVRFAAAEDAKVA